MFITTYSDLYPNLSFAPDVSETMRDIIVDVYHDYFASNPRFSREILITPSHEHRFPDRIGLLYENFGFLFYDPAHETPLMAYAMFAWIEMLGDVTWNDENIYTHSVSFDYVLISALKVCPRECITTFADLPYMGVLKDITIRDDQIPPLRHIGDHVYGRLNMRGVPKNTIEWMRDYLLTNMVPCKLEHMLGANVSLKITRNLGNWKQRAISKLEKHVMNQLVLHGTVDSHFKMNLPIHSEEPIVFTVNVTQDPVKGTSITMSPKHSALTYILQEQEQRDKHKPKYKRKRVVVK